MGHDRDPVLQQQIDELVKRGVIDHAQAEGMADVDFSLKPKGFRPFSNEFDGESAKRARLVDVNIHSHPVPPCHLKNRIDVADRIPVDGARVDASDEICSSSDGFLQEVQPFQAGPVGRSGEKQRFEPSSRL